MGKKNTLSTVAIAARVKAGKSFTVSTASERTRVLQCAKYFGIRLTTRKGEAELYDVLFI